MSDVLHHFGHGIGWITLNRPDRMNAVTVALARGLQDALRLLDDRADVNVIVIRGAGENFCAGGDFDELQRLRREGADHLRTLFEAFRDACAVIAQIGVPVIAAVEGAAAAGGFELMQAADIVLVSDDAQISDSHINFGMIPGGGSTARLARIVGRQEALALLLSGDRFSGVQAVTRGLAYRSYPHDEFDSAVRNFATRLAERRPDAVAAIKRLVYTGIDSPLSDGLDNEMSQVIRHIIGQAGGNGVAAFHNREVRR